MRNIYIITHIDIMEKLKSRDADGYRNAMLVHLLPFREFLYNYTEK